MLNGVHDIKTKASWTIIDSNSNVYNPVVNSPSLLAQFWGSYKVTKAASAIVKSILHNYNQLYEGGNSTITVILS